jgi:5-methylcytosine-specific restriction endonuclease McrA
VKAKRPKPITARNACDRLFSQLIRSQGACQNCGRTDQLQCAHIISRRYSWTRTDTGNAFCLCAKCHWNFHREPDEWMDFIDRTIGRLNYLELKSRANRYVGIKFDWFVERERLKLLHRELWERIGG